MYCTLCKDAQPQKRFIYIDIWPSLCGWLQTCKSLGSGSLLDRTEWGTAVFLGAVSSQVPAQPAARQSFILKWSCRLAGIVNVYVWLEYADDPSEGHTGQLAYTFVIRILYINVSHLRFNFFVCCCSKVIYLCSALLYLYSTRTYFKPSQRPSTRRRYFLSFPALSTIDCFICWKRLEKVEGKNCL